MIKFDVPKNQQDEQPDSSTKSSISFGQTKSEPVQVHSRPVSPFHNKDSDAVSSLVQEILNKYPSFASEQNQLKQMVKTLINPTLDSLITWGESALIEQKNLVTFTSARIKEFIGLDAEATLAQALDFNKNKQKGFLAKFTNKLSNMSAYSNKINMLNQHMYNLLPIFSKSRDECINNKLPLYLAVLATAADNYKGNDNLIIDAYYNRRVLLTGAVKNLEMLKSQIEQNIDMLNNMLNEASHIINVVIPALALNS